MSHFNLKSLTFYTVAIGSVVLLFKVVTAYGESNLKAATPIDGRYAIPINNLPVCETMKSVVLTINQSGIYLNGNLLPEATKAESSNVEEKPSLEGRWQGTNLVLSGLVSQPKLCGEAVKNEEKNAQKIGVKITATFAEQKLEGTLELEAMEKPIAFSANREVKGEQKQTH